MSKSTLICDYFGEEVEAATMYIVQRATDPPKTVCESCAKLLISAGYSVIYSPDMAKDVDAAGDANKKDQADDSDNRT